MRNKWLWFIVVPIIIISVLVPIHLEYNTFEIYVVLVIGNIVLLNFLYANFMKPFVNNYSKEKGKNLATFEDVEKITRKTEKILLEFKDDVGSETFIEKQIEYIDKFWFEFSDLHNKLYRRIASFMENVPKGNSFQIKLSANHTKIIKEEFSDRMYYLRGYKIFLTQNTIDIFERYFSNLRKEGILDMTIFTENKHESNNLHQIYDCFFDSIRNDLSNLMSRNIKIKDYFK